MIKIIAALMLVLAVGCGGVEESVNSPDFGGCSQSVGSYETNGAKGIEWDCESGIYSANCKLSYTSDGSPNVFCDCTSIDLDTMDLLLGSGKASKSMTKDGQIPSDPLSFAKFVSKIDGCEWWSPPFLSP